MTWRELYCKVSVGPTLATRGSPRDMDASSDPSSSTRARSSRATGRGYLPTKMSGSLGCYHGRPGRGCWSSAHVTAGVSRAKRGRYGSPMTVQTCLRFATLCDVLWVSEWTLYSGCLGRGQDKALKGYGLDYTVHNHENFPMWTG